MRVFCCLKQKIRRTKTPLLSGIGICSIAIGYEICQMSYRLVRKCTLEDNRDADCVLCCKHIFGPSKTRLNFYNPGVTRAKKTFESAQNHIYNRHPHLYCYLVS